MDIQAPRRLEESKTIALAKGQQVFNRILAAAIALAESGILFLVPAQYQKELNLAVIFVGAIALVAGNEQKGKQLIQERLSKLDLHTPPTDNRAPNQIDARFVIRASAAEAAKVQEILGSDHLI